MVADADAILSPCVTQKMAEISPQVEIPNRALFKAAEVCDLAKVQPYVLRSWEAEFKGLGVTRGNSSVRVYRREDVELVLRIKHLLLIEGLTLAGVRRRLDEESEPPLEDEVAVAEPAPLAKDTRTRDRPCEAGPAVVARSARHARGSCVSGCGICPGVARVGRAAGVEIGEARRDGGRGNEVGLASAQAFGVE